MVKCESFPIDLLIIDNVKFFFDMSNCFAFVTDLNLLKKLSRDCMFIKGNEKIYVEVLRKRM